MTMNANWLAGLSVAALVAATQAQTFTGASGADMLCSNTNNWSAFPVDNGPLTISANGTSAGNPALVDGAFTVPVSNFRVYSTAGFGTGMSYAEVVPGGRILASSLFVGNKEDASYNGTLVVRSGASVENRFLNSGSFEIGGNSAGMEGHLVVEPGAFFRMSRMDLNAFGQLTLKLGDGSATPLLFSKTTSGNSITLDGLIRVDLADLATPGTYTLIDSGSTNLLVAGALKTWLDGNGGSRGGSGDFSNAVFAAENVPPGWEWTLGLADGGQDLVLMAGPEGYAAVQAELANASITFQPGDSAAAVTGNLAFSTAAEEGVALEWVSSAPLIVGADGKVYRPRKAACFLDDDIPVVATAVASKNGYSASREFVLAVVPSNDPAAPLYQGRWEPFWRAMPVIGEWMAGSEGGEVIPEYLKRHSFCYQLKDQPQEIPFADQLNAVRLIGGWNEGGGAENPVPAHVADLVYKDAGGQLLYRWDKLAARLDPYIDAGYTNLTLVLDNIPYCFPSSIVMEEYGQVATPANFAEWRTFVSNLCVALADLYGFDMANQFRFRQGTEAQSIRRFAGTQEEYFKIYDHSAAAVKSVLPGAKFGPFNNAGGKSNPAVNNVDMLALADHCASGTNYATGEVGSPFDFISISSYIAQASHPHNPLSEVNTCAAFFENVQARLAQPATFEIHEFGILRCEADLPTGEPGARGAGWNFHTIGGLRETGVSRWYHWDIFDTFRSRSGGLHKLLHSEGWLLAVLDRTAGGEAFTLKTSVPANAATQVKAIGVFGGERDWIMAGAFNPGRLVHDPETVSVRVPLHLLRAAAGDRILWTSLNQTNSAHWLVRKDLEENGMLNADFAAVPEQLAGVRTMTTNATLSAEQDFLGARIGTYEQAVIDSLTLKPFDGTVVTNGGEVVFTLTLRPPETAVVCIGPDRTAAGVPYAWLDSYGLATKGYAAAEQGDPDGDGFTSAQEYVAGTDPQDSTSVPYALSVVASKDTALVLNSTRNKADLGAATGLYVNPVGNIALLQFDLSGADYPLTNAVLTLTATTARTGAWFFDVRAMVPTANNHAWFEGLGTASTGNNTDNPASATGAACYLYRNATGNLPWEDGSGNGVANAGSVALWGSVLGSFGGTNMAAGQSFSIALDAAALDAFRATGSVVLGVRNTAAALSGNAFFASKENTAAAWRPMLQLQMDPALAITSISTGALNGSHAVSVVFDAAGSASLWFTPELADPSWSNVASGASPLGHTNAAPAGFYKVTIP